MPSLLADRLSPFRQRTRTAARGAIALAALLIGSLLVVLPSPNASAAPNPGIVVGVTKVESGSGPDGQLVVGDKAFISGTWDASAADPKEGDQFTIGLPAEFSFAQSITFPLSGADEDGNPTVWGNCSMGPATRVATCTLNDAVEDLDDVAGTWEFEISVDAATTEEEVEFDLNGTNAPVKLPGTGGIDPGKQLPDAVSKSGYMNANNWSMTWTVDIPGSSLKNFGGDAQIKDTFGPGHLLCDPTNFKVATVDADGKVLDTVTGLVEQLPAHGTAGFDIVLKKPDAGWDTGVTYRITYDTCTIDKEIDPEGTVYENSMQIVGWGTNGEGVGKVTNRPWKLDLSKSGSVLGSGERNGKLRWTVTVPGDELVNQTSFTFSEVFGDGHELCTDTISGIRITERYGPSNQRQTDITSELTASVNSQSSTGFDMTFTITDPASFAFKASDWRYIITYETCVTETELPAGGTKYTNAASVDGRITTGTATVPGRTSNKTGAISSSTVTIDGVEHDPRTTFNWTVTIPGRQIEDQNLTGALSLVDRLSDTHQVCIAGESSDGLAARLNLKVVARDQINGGGLDPVDLTSATTVTQDGPHELTFTLDPVNLPLPGGGLSDGFSREYQYVLTYTTCTTSGGLDAPGTEYSNEIEGFGNSFKPTLTLNYRGSGTGQGKSRGSVAVQKDLNDNAAASFVPAGTKFKVHVKEIDPTGAIVTEYDLDVPLDGEPVSGFNSRGNGWTFELSEPTMPEVPGVTWGTPVFAKGEGVEVKENGSVAIATIKPRSNIAVQLTNTALLGSVELAKDLDGPAAAQVPADREFSVTAKIDTSALGSGFPAQPDRVVQVSSGKPVVLRDLPIGATVTFTETPPLDDDLFTWTGAAFSPATVTVGAGHVAAPAKVTLTNTVERTVGTFAISKTVTGAQANNPAVPDDVTVTATWTEEGGTPQTKTLTVPTDGSRVPLGEKLLIGTEVTLTETPLRNGSSIAWGSPVWSGPGVTTKGTSAVVRVGRDASAEVKLENHAATSTAGLSLIKGISGEAAAEVAPETRFPVTVTWGSGGPSQTRELMIGTAEPTPLGVSLPAGTVVTITEGAAPEQSTVVWGDITINGPRVTDAGDGSARVVISDQHGEMSLVTIDNEATWAPGTFGLAKQVVGVAPDHPDVPDTVAVVASWRDDEGVEHSAEVAVPTDGSVAPLGVDLPHGTEVVLTETLPAESPSFTWNLPRWTGDDAEVVTQADGSAVVTVGAATAPTFTVENSVTARLAELELTKKLAGKGAAKVPARTRFPVTVTWTDITGAEHVVETHVRPGRTRTIKDVPLGVPVTFVESAADLPRRLTWDGVSWSGSGRNVTFEGQTSEPTAVATITGPAAITVTNTIGGGDTVVKDDGKDGDSDRDEDGRGDDGEGDTTPDGADGLGDTGGPAGWLLVAALGLLVAGGLTLRGRRRTS